MNLSKFVAISLLLGSSQQAATQLKNTDYPRYHANLSTLPTGCGAAASLTRYEYVRSNGLYAVPQKMSGGTSATVPPAKERAFWTSGLGAGGNTFGPVATSAGFEFCNCSAASTTCD